MVDLSRRAFNKRVTIKTVTKTADDSKGHNESYSELMTTWCVVDSKGGDKRFSDGMLTVFDRKDFYITWQAALSEVTTDAIFVFEEREYKMTSPGTFDHEQKHIIKYETIGR